MSRRLFIRGRSSQSRLAALLGRDIADVRAELERGGGPNGATARPQHLNHHIGTAPVERRHGPTGPRR